MLFESSFCWKCKNFSLDYPDSPEWVEIQGQELEQAFAQVMPIPEAEKDRFKARLGGEKAIAKPGREPASKGQSSRAGSQNHEDGE